VTSARVLVTLATFMIVGLQIALFTQWRFGGVVVFIIWLWPVAVGLTGVTSLALFSGVLAGVLFDAQTATPFGLSALVGLALGYMASRLGKEGVGDLDSAAWWVTPTIAAAAGGAAPLFYVISGVVAWDFSLWRGSLVNSMVVNAVAFFVLSRPLTRLALALCAPAMKVRR